ncbi:MAG TPA: tyrosine-type recombinase/integrase [Anaerolineaceae bacterium]|nr:tyrosine-type recombinase/integrase [Anaerolineaceae bacterium]
MNEQTPITSSEISLNPTIRDAISAYLDSVSMARSANTSRTYRNGMQLFQEMLAQHKVNPQKTSIDKLPENAITWFIAFLKNYAPTSERLYLTAVTSFYEYLAAENLVQINLPRIRLLIRQRARRPGQRLPQFPSDAIEKVLEYVSRLNTVPCDDEQIHLRNLRDKAFLFTLADTGLRVHEACNLRRGDIDWNEGRAIVIGKGNREAVVRFSRRSQQAIKEYLAARASLDGLSGRPLTALPLFARHDKGASKKVQPITTATGRNIVIERVTEAIGPDAVGTITPHSFRHYFVTRVLKTSGNLKLAQELARHRNIAVTQRYAHLSDDELDHGYWEVFEE